MKEVKSKVYKAVKNKDGDCIIVRKQKLKPKKKGVKKSKQVPSKPEVVSQERKQLPTPIVKPKSKISKAFDLIGDAIDIFKSNKKEPLKARVFMAEKPKLKARVFMAEEDKIAEKPIRGGKRKPLPVRIVPDPVPVPSPFESLILNKQSIEQKLEADRKQRYDRNVALNSKDSQQGLVLGEQGLLSVPTIPTLGKGVEEDGMYDYEIEDIMKKFPEFKGVIAADEIRTIKPAKKIAFVMNTSDRDEPGEHWVSVIIDSSPNVRAVEFFDPFGRPPSKKTKQDLKSLVRKIEPETMLLYKWNLVKQQDISSNTCGLHAMNFLMKRLNGKSFIEATGYSPKKPKDQSKKYEAEVLRKFRELM